MPKLIAVAGPTASGKSALGMELAAALGGEIVNGDSRQVYAGMVIGTAMPSPADMARVPHHLFAYTDPGEPFSLALYRQAATAAFEDCWSRGVIPFLVGGTGQYLWALLEDWSVPEVPPDDALRQRLFVEAETNGATTLHARLESLDPLAASRIDARNVRRVVRALEVIEHTGRPMSEAQSRGTPAFESLVLGVTLPREELDARIDARVQQMFDAGFVAEVQRLRDEGYGRDLPSMSSIGYSQVHAHLDGELTREEAITETARATRRLARKQAAWFRPADPRIHWVSGLDEAMVLVREFLAVSR